MKTVDVVTEVGPTFVLVCSKVLHELHPMISIRSSDDRMRIRKLESSLGFFGPYFLQKLK